MALRKFLKKEERKEVFLTENLLKKVDLEVQSFDQTTSFKKRGRYNLYSPEQRADIGKYTAENGPAHAAAQFSQLFGFSENSLLGINKLIFFSFQNR